MSKHDGDFRTGGEISTELEELLAALGHAPQATPDRTDAMAHYLSAEEGWLDARKALRGTFARPVRGAAGLTGDQDR